MNNDKQPTQGNFIEPFNIERMREAIEAINKIKPLETLKNVYVNEQGWQRLFTEVSGFKLSASMDRAYYCGVLIISDQDVPHNKFIMCSAEDWQYYKRLCGNPVINIYALTDDQVNYCISILKRGDKQPEAMAQADTLRYLPKTYLPHDYRTETDPFGFGKTTDNDTTT